MVQEKKDRIVQSYWLLVLVLFSTIILSCSKKQDAKAIITYKGPMIESDTIETRYSDSARLKIKLTAPKQMELQNGNRVFPKGVYVEFYNEKTGQLTSTLKANSGIFYKEQNNYNVKGNVIIRNLEKKERLNTEELNWDPDTKKINTDKFVRIETPEQILTGTGLDAAQDFSYYKLRKIEAIFSVDNEEDEEYEE